MPLTSRLPPTVKFDDTVATPVHYNIRDVVGPLISGKKHTAILPKVLLNCLKCSISTGSTDSVV